MEREVFEAEVWAELSGISPDELAELVRAEGVTIH